MEVLTYVICVVVMVSMLSASAWVALKCRRTFTPSYPCDRASSTVCSNYAQSSAMLSRGPNLLTPRGPKGCKQKLAPRRKRTAGNESSTTVMELTHRLEDSKRINNFLSGIVIYLAIAALVLQMRLLSVRSPAAAPTCSQQCQCPAAPASLLPPAYAPGGQRLPNLLHKAFASSTAIRHTAASMNAAVCAHAAHTKAQLDSRARAIHEAAHAHANGSFTTAKLQLEQACSAVSSRTTNLAFEAATAAQRGWDSLQRAGSRLCTHAEGAVLWAGKHYSALLVSLRHQAVASIAAAADWTATQWAALQDGCARMRADAYTAMALAAHEGRELALGTYTTAQEWTGQAATAAATVAHKACAAYTARLQHACALVTAMRDWAAQRWSSFAGGCNAASTNVNTNALVALSGAHGLAQGAHTALAVRLSSAGGDVSRLLSGVRDATAAAARGPTTANPIVPAILATTILLAACCIWWGLGPQSAAADITPKATTSVRRRSSAGPLNMMARRLSSAASTSPINTASSTCPVALRADDEDAWLLQDLEEGIAMLAHAYTMLKSITNSPCASTRPSDDARVSLDGLPSISRPRPNTVLRLSSEEQLLHHPSTPTLTGERRATFDSQCSSSGGGASQAMAAVQGLLARRRRRRSALCVASPAKRLMRRLAEVRAKASLQRFATPTVWSVLAAEEEAP